MPQILHTPESLLPRSDSKNPATTCRGMTASGRPCRRSLATSPRSFQNTESNEVVFGMRSPDGRCADNENQYCWQHREQAPSRLPSAMNVKVLRRRSSFDTVLEQLGVLQIHDKPNVRRRKDDRPASLECKSETGKQSKVQQKPRNIFSLLLCWTPVDDEEYLEIVRHKKRNENHKSPNDKPESSATTHVTVKKKTPARAGQTAGMSHRTPHEKSPVTASCRDWQQYMPPSLSPLVQAQLMAEMAKPISAADEDGYIYVFWLTDSTLNTPTHLESFIDTRNRETPNHFGRLGVKNRSSQKATTELSSPDHNAPKLLIKIGRATNVHRRLASWTQQCGYKLSLIRFYPRVEESALSEKSPLVIGNDRNPRSPPLLSPNLDVPKVPFSHRVERLIHLELLQQQVQQGRCSVCGKSHREWFEVDASREGLRIVDEVIKRWVTWAEELRMSREP